MQQGEFIGQFCVGSEGQKVEESVDSKGHLHGFQMDTNSLPETGQEALLICPTTTTTKWIAFCPCPKSLSKTDFKVMNSLSGERL